MSNLNQQSKTNVVTEIERTGEDDIPEIKKVMKREFAAKQ